MNAITIITALISAITAICVALLNRNAEMDKKNRKERQKIIDDREKRREERDNFILKYMELNADLAEAQTIAITEGTHNGELKRAQGELTKLRNDYQEWLRQIALSMNEIDLH